MQRAAPAQAVRLREHNRHTHRQISSRRQNFEYSVKPCVAVPAEFDDFGRRLAAELADFLLERRRNVEDRRGWWGMNGPAGRRPPGGTTMANKTIISCAITGSIHTQTM